MNSRESLRQRLSAHQRLTLDDAELALVISPADAPIAGKDDVTNRVDWLASWPMLSALQLAMTPSASSRQLAMLSVSTKPNGLELAIVGHSRRDLQDRPSGSAMSQSAMISNNDLLMALPSESVIAAVGFEPRTAMLASSGFIDWILGYLQQSSFVDARAIEELSRRMKRSISRASVGSIAFQSPANDSNAYIATLILQTKADAAIIRAEFQSIMSQLQRGFFIDPVWKSYAKRLKIIPLATSYQGVSIDYLSVEGMDVNRSAATSSMPGMISTDGILARMAVIDDSVFVLVVGAKAQGMNEVIQRWRGHQTPLSSTATIVSYAATRRSPVSAEGYISSDGLQRLAGFKSHNKKRSGGVINITETSWASFSSINVEVGVERFDMFLPYGWLDQIMQHHAARN